MLSSWFRCAYSESPPVQCSTVTLTLALTLGITVCYRPHSVTSTRRDSPVLSQNAVPCPVHSSARCKVRAVDTYSARCPLTAANTPGWRDTGQSGRRHKRTAGRLTGTSTTQNSLALCVDSRRVATRCCIEYRTHQKCWAPLRCRCPVARPAWWPDNCPELSPGDRVRPET